MRNLLIGLAAVALCAGTAVADTPQDWKTYRYPELGLAVDLPSPPTVSAKSRSLPSGHSLATSRLLVLVDDRSWIIVDATTNPDATFTPAEAADPAFRSAMMGIELQITLLEAGATVISDREIKVQGSIAHDVTFETKAVHTIGRAWFIGSGVRRYAVMAIATADRGVPVEFDRVAHSLTLLDPPRP